jgi:hypothetical protein
MQTSDIALLTKRCPVCSAVVYRLIVDEFDDIRAIECIVCYERWYVEVKDVPERRNYYELVPKQQPVNTTSYKSEQLKPIVKRKPKGRRCDQCGRRISFNNRSGICRICTPGYNGEHCEQCKTCNRRLAISNKSGYCWRHKEDGNENSP